MDNGSPDNFIKTLFHVMLGRQSIGEEEFSYWADELRNGRSHAEVFELFWKSEENQARIANNHNVNAQFPHGHFYSPVVDLDEVVTFEGYFDRKRATHVRMEDGDVRATLAAIAPFFQDMPFTDRKSAKLRYYYDNTSFGFGDAAVYWGMISAFRPKRIIEVGSGFTSALALDAIDALNLDTTCTFIDPYPDLLLRVARPMGERHKVLAQKVQTVDPAIVEELEANDILFIDSSHVVKTGSDVLFEITQLLPRLKSGVIVHFHDMFYPYEYPREWVLKEKYSWNELYFVQVFLMYNEAFKVIYFNDYVGHEKLGALREVTDAATADRIAINPGGGLWLKRA